MKRPLLDAQARLGHRLSARDLQAFDSRFDATFDHLGDAIIRPGGIVRNADDRRFAPGGKARKNAPEQADVVEMLTGP